MTQYIITIYEPLNDELSFIIDNIPYEQGTDKLDEYVDRYETNTNVVVVAHLTKKNVNNIKRLKLCKLRHGQRRHNIRSF